MQEIFENITCINRTPVYSEHKKVCPNEDWLRQVYLYNTDGKPVDSKRPWVLCCDVQHLRKRYSPVIRYEWNAQSVVVSMRGNSVLR